ncbi:acid-sensing ion channel 4-like [Lingula anatina]|uniref:Acid-sensing ion channel 4-like n=1 Tax=Lingula anatina TaxID=7574 RepID=A0A1S3HYS9_LINAN|nr:acid-sensing ion channel 4-like [Lingula anatina]|eukprot:XP_013390239.1 acid-sensing ion channel 4-like [Lingula anatina]
MSSAFCVRVHNPHEFPEIQSRGLLVAPGATTQISIKQARTLRSSAPFKAQNLPSPYGNCRDGSLTYFREYSKVNCMAECNHKNIMQKCGCRLHYYPPVAGTRECSPYDVYTCVGQQLVIDSDEKAAALNCDCSEPCSGVSYQHGVTHSRISDSYANYSATITGKSPEYVRSNYVILKVYYSDLSYQETIQSASYPFLTLLADIGGALGLVLGMTMMTLVEVVDFCFQLCWLQFYKRKT